MRTIEKPVAQFRHCDWHHCRSRTMPGGQRDYSASQRARPARWQAGKHSVRRDIVMVVRQRHQGRQDNEITSRPSHSTARPSVRLAGLSQSYRACHVPCVRLEQLTTSCARVTYVKRIARPSTGRGHGRAVVGPSLRQDATLATSAHRLSSQTTSPALDQCNTSTTTLGLPQVSATERQLE